MSETYGPPGTDAVAREALAGHAAPDVEAGAGAAGGGPAAGPGAQAGQPLWSSLEGPPKHLAPAGALRPEPPAGAPCKPPPGTPLPPLGLVVHCVDGALCTSMLAPFVRVHVVDPESGLPWRKADHSRHAVFNVDAKGAPYLRMNAGRQEPWQADVSPAAFVKPFATRPCHLHRVRAGARREPPRWDEEFLVAELLAPGSMLMFEVIDAADALRSAAEDGEGAEGGGAAPSYARLGWGFLDLGGVLGAGRAPPRGRRLRLQLHRYQDQARRERGAGASSGLLSRLTRTGAEADGPGEAPAEDGAAARPEVFAEYRPEGAEPEAAPSWAAAALALLAGRAAGGLRRRLPWPAVLEVTLSVAARALDLASIEESINAELSLSRISPQGERSLGDATAPADASGEAAAAEGAQESPGRLLPHHFRHREQPCCVPDDLLWQINVGKRGASRLSCSPSGKLLAAAAARQGGASELRIFTVATGRLHAACAVLHDALVYDLCWHAFGVQGSPAGHPLLISCGGDCAVQVYEVPEDGRGRAAPLLRPAAQLRLPSHVYTVAVHPAMSTDPRRLVLLCGGHSFGLALCELVRQAPAEGGGEGAAWALAGMQTADMSKAMVRSPHAAGESPVHQAPSPLRAHRQEPQEALRLPDVLCARFSTQPTTPDNAYVSDAAGRVLLFQVRFDASLNSGQGSMRVSFVRVYGLPELQGVPIYALDVVTPQLVQGRRLNSIQVSLADDWVLLYARDHRVRLCSLQRGVARVEVPMAGLESGNYPVRGAMSPDGAYVACGSETGELLLWDARSGKALPGGLPRVQLAGPVMDVVWGERQHLVACCALDAQAPPLLLFVGGDPEYRPPPEPEPKAEPPLRPVPPRAAPREALMLQGAAPQQALVSVAPPVAAANGWALQWLEMNENPRSALAFEEKRAMKERILSQLMDRKGAVELEQHFASVRIPGGL